MLETLVREGRVCKVVKIWRTLDESDRTIFAAAVNDRHGWPAIRLERELRRRGILISNDTILAHRAENCACEERWF